MTKPIKASEHGLAPHYKVRVVVGTALLHLASKDTPRVLQGEHRNVIAEWIEDPQYGDTLGYVDWDAVTAISWRYSP